MRGAQERDTGVWTGGVRRGVLDAACGVCPRLRCLGGPVYAAKPWACRPGPQQQVKTHAVLRTAPARGLTGGTRCSQLLVGGAGWLAADKWRASRRQLRGPRLWLQRCELGRRALGRAGPARRQQALVAQACSTALLS